MALTKEIVHPHFEAAATVFKNYADANAEAQLAVYVNGELVLDLAANIAPDALTTVYSVSKALATLALAKLVQRGQLELDQTVAHYWPEFAAGGKQNITIRQLFSHQAGIPETDPRLTKDQFLSDHEAAKALAAQKPFWFPGNAHGYHALTLGPLMSEVCYRITGQTIQQFYESEVRTQANSEAYLGIPEELESRVVELLPGMPPTAEQLAKYGPPPGFRPGPYAAHVFGNSSFITSAEGRRFGLASASGMATARGLADTMQWAVGYGTPAGAISADVLEDFAQAQVYGTDAVVGNQVRSYGIGFMKPTSSFSFGSLRAFGHDGAAGSFIMADPIGKIVVGYTLRRLEYPGGMDPRLFPVLDAIRKTALAN